MTRFLLPLSLALLACTPMSAQPAFPSKPVTLVVPFPAGGALDVVARALAEEMRKHLGQPVIVENRVGAGGTLGSGVVARAAPDGHTILFGSVATHAIASGLYAKLTYDALKDFAGIELAAGLAGSAPRALNLQLDERLEGFDWESLNLGRA